jgi:acetoin utilization deacetylase AcuC-like enzyme
MRCFYHPGYYFPLPPEHPFPMEKFRVSMELIRAARPELPILPVAAADEADLLRVHSADYLQRIRHGLLSREERVRLGLPEGEELLARCRRETAGTIAAARAALEDGIACNLAGGTHHAFADRGLGYCVLNDTVVAIRALRVEHPELKVMVIDTDAHQGNGTHHLLAEDARSFTYSIHVGRNYPAHKTPGSLDVELPRWVAGTDYLAALESTLPASFAEFKPDLVVWISGADNHVDDLFGQMRMSEQEMQARDAFVLTLCLEAETPVAALYGGGYNRDRLLTAKLHANTVLLAAELSG